MRRINWLIIMLFIFSLVSGGCASGKTEADANTSNAEASEKLKIFTSFYPMFYLTSEIAGDKAHVINLIPSGAEPHDWEPAPKTIAEIHKGDMFVYNGLGMESWAEKISQNMKDKVKIVVASEGLEYLKGEEHEHDSKIEGDSKDEPEHSNYDPHIWVSPKRAKLQANNILKALITIDPNNKAYYTENYNKLAEKLDNLDKDIKEAVKSFKSNVIVVSHDAFRYLANDYGMKQIAIRGVSPEEEPSPAKMAELVKQCREHKVKYIFFEKLVSPKLSETLAKEIGTKTLILNDAAGLTEEDIKSGKNYITLMYENLENLRKALNEQ